MMLRPQINRAPADASLDLSDCETLIVSGVDDPSFNGIYTQSGDFGHGGSASWSNENGSKVLERVEANRWRFDYHGEAYFAVSSLPYPPSQGWNSPDIRIECGDSAPLYSPRKITVFDAPDAAFNGDYFSNNTLYNNAPIFAKDATHWFYYVPAWEFFTVPPSVSSAAVYRSYSSGQSSDVTTISSYGWMDADYNYLNDMHVELIF